MDTNLKALKDLYISLGGEESDLENITTSSEMIAKLKDIVGGGNTNTNYILDCHGDEDIPYMLKSDVDAIFNSDIKKGSPFVYLLTKDDEAHIANFYDCFLFAAQPGYEYRNYYNFAFDEEKVLTVAEIDLFKSDNDNTEITYNYRSYGGDDEDDTYVFTLDPEDESRYILTSHNEEPWTR